MTSPVVVREAVLSVEDALATLRAAMHHAALHGIEVQVAGHVWQGRRYGQQLTPHVELTSRVFVVRYE